MLAILLRPIHDAERNGKLSRYFTGHRCNLNTLDPLSNALISAETFANLLTLIQQGSPEAEARLVERFHKPLFYALRHRIGDETLASDICQETWRILLEKFRLAGPSVLDDCTLLPAYIRNTAINLYLAELKRIERRRTELDNELLEEIPDHDDGNPVEQLNRSKVQQRVREVIDGMHNARDKLILYRYYIQEQSKEQICVELGLESRHFDRVAHRARERLRQAVNKIAGDLAKDFKG